MYDRLVQWSKFDLQVEEHIEQYAKQQYGNDMGDKQLEEFTSEDCFQAIIKYVSRRQLGLRGDKERLRDAIKIAHWASVAYDKLKDELGESDVY